MANTNATIILSIASFYVFIGVMLGLIGSSFTAPAPVDPTAPSSVTSFLDGVAYFFAGIAFAIGGFPWWANALLFLPLGATLLYIVISLLRGSS